MSEENQIKEKEMNVIYEVNKLKIHIKALYAYIVLLMGLVIILTFLNSFKF